MKITESIKYVGVNDHQVDLFEGQYHVPNGMAYNSYVILDEKIAVMDTVDANFTHEWLDNLDQVLAGRKPDYLIVQHMEPDHAANVANFLKVYPDTTVVANAKTFQMIRNFFGLDLDVQKLEVTNGGTLSLGKHQLTFVFARWYTGRKLWSPMTVLIKYYSLQTDLENSALWMWKKIGMMKPADILSVS